VLVFLANYVSTRSPRVSVLTWDDGKTKPVYSLAPSISHVPLNLVRHSETLSQGLRQNVMRLGRLRRAIQTEKPDLVVSFMEQTNVLTLLSMVGTGIPVVVAERSDPQAWPKETLWRFLRLFTYPLARNIVVQTVKAKNYFPQWLQRKISCIPNAVAPCVEHLLPSSSTTVLAVGRLDSCKRYDLLLRAMARLRDRHPDWTLIIAGDGPLRSELERFSSELGLESCVEFMGDVSDVESYRRKASLYVLPSDFEGFPNTLCEAMACGLAVIATATAGAQAIIQDGVDGVLVSVGSLEGLVAEMDRLMSNALAREQLGQRARDISNRYSMTMFRQLWSELIEFRRQRR
jgi:GalNAc-alpha-(1->4)-GalNAc-alpha-(1->3)-diNAcBac-PP-undecaprenol alpha-1,4-N-acetyl-D-galactosaminyltransferase